MAFARSGRRPSSICRISPATNWRQRAPAAICSVQACADNPQVAFHAVRQLARLAYGVANIRWVQAGFVSDFGADRTPRNLMGFKDGTGNPATSDPKEMDAVVWAGEEAPPWMRGGSYMVVRRARIALEHWDRMNVAFQEQTFGREKLSGAPLGAREEFDPIDLDAKNANGDPVVPENSHVRIAHQMAKDGSRILRRSYSYNDGANVTAERWPPLAPGHGVRRRARLHLLPARSDATASSRSSRRCRAST